MSNENTWHDEMVHLTEYLSGVLFLDQDGVVVDNDAAFDRWRTLTINIREARKTLFLIGNGASASMASHYAADLAKNGHLHTQVFSDLSLITAISNDMSYSEVFAEPLRRCAVAGDMLIAISSSGASENILKAVDVANEIGVNVITLSAMSPENPLRKQGLLNVYVAAMSYGHAETCHTAVLHHWMDLVDIRNEYNR